MSLPPEQLRYPMRRYGMDHDRYSWSILPRRKKVEWPGGARVALWIVPALEWFPLNMSAKPFNPPGGMVTAYPDLRHYSLRDYGNRVGVYRLMDALAQRSLKASVPVNAAVATRYPSLVKNVAARGWELLGHGLDMAHLHYSGVTDERSLVETSLATVGKFATGKVRGWLSPAKSESFATPDLLTAAGIEYVCDWVNDDMPFAMQTESGPLYCMPHNPDIDDFTILIQNHHTEADFTHELQDQFDCLYDEAGRFGGRIVAISLRPWVIGQPYRIGALERALDHMLSRPGVWSATGAEILDAWKAQQ